MASWNITNLKINSQREKVKHKEDIALNNIEDSKHKTARINRQ